MGMTHEELIEGLRKNALWVTTHDAADRIEALVQESNRRLDLARSEGVARVFQFERAEAAEAKLAKAVDAIQKMIEHEHCPYDVWKTGTDAVAELEKTE